MFESFLVLFRESLEAALVVGVVMAFLRKSNLQKYYPLVMTAIVAAVFVSLTGAYVFAVFAGGFEGVAEEIFEGVTMFLAAVFLTYMILWLYGQKNAKTLLEARLGQATTRSVLFFVVFFAVLREGIETVLFLNAILFSSGDLVMWGGFLGIFLAILIGYLLFVLEVKLPMRKFFQVSSVLLIFFAAGLLAHGVHEFQEAQVLPVFIEHLYDVNFLIDENGQVGQILKGVLGYNGNPSLLETLAYLFYVSGAFYLFYRNSNE